MNIKKKEKIARKIFEIEENQNIKESYKIKEIDELISNLSIEDLLEIDELIMKKYLTNLN